MTEKLDEIAERTCRIIKAGGLCDLHREIRAALDEAVAEERKRILNELSDNPLIASLLDAREAKPEREVLIDEIGDRLRRAKR